MILNRLILYIATFRNETFRNFIFIEYFIYIFILKLYTTFSFVFCINKKNTFF